MQKKRQKNRNIEEIIWNKGKITIESGKNEKKNKNSDEAKNLS
jgi:hypothetical protein